MQLEAYMKQGICKNVQALSLYVVEYLWKLKFNSYPEQSISQNLNLEAYTK